MANCEKCLHKKVCTDWAVTLFEDEHPVFSKEPKDIKCNYFDDASFFYKFPFKVGDISDKIIDETFKEISKETDLIF